MSRRDLLNDSPCLQFISNFSPSPLTDRAPGLHRRFACDCGDLTPLLSGDPGWRFWTGGIGQALRNTEGVQIHALECSLALSPQPNGIHIDCQLARNLDIGVALCRAQDNAHLQYLLPFTAMTFDEVFLIRSALFHQISRTQKSLLFPYSQISSRCDA